MPRLRLAHRHAGPQTELLGKHRRAVVKSIPTTYRDVEYRSRLEAKWAAFFDQLGWQHTYEPFDGDGYLPDFLIHGDRPMLVEVKPAVSDADYRAAIHKVTAGLTGHWSRDVLLLGADPLPMLASAPFVDYLSAGLLGENLHDDALADGMQPDWYWDVGKWCICRECHQINVFHSVQQWIGRPCGHYDGGNNLGNVDPSTIRRHWATATNCVKWRAT